MREAPNTWAGDRRWCWCFGVSGFPVLAATAFVVVGVSVKRGSGNGGGSFSFHFMILKKQSIGFWGCQKDDWCSHFDDEAGFRFNFEKNKTSIGVRRPLGFWCLYGSGGVVLAWCFEKKNTNYQVQFVTLPALHWDPEPSRDSAVVVERGPWQWQAIFKWPLASCGPEYRLGGHSIHYR